jgi:class 3 adenylate cyclase/TolB-like protein
MGVIAARYDDTRPAADARNLLLGDDIGQFRAGFCAKLNRSKGRAMSETRKIAAILVSDVVGYSRLAGADEGRTLSRLRGLRSDLIDPAIDAHHGRIVKRTGDGSIIEFRSVVDAVRCAIEVQSAMVERNAGVPDDRRIVFRIGIHLGDVVEESDGDLMGDGVNVAARLEGICEPGGLCLSGAAHEQVRDRMKERFADLGEKQLKNIARPVRAFGLSPSAIAAAMTGVASPRPALKASGLWARWPALAAALALALIAAGGYAWRAGYAPRLLGASIDDKLTSAPRLSIVVLPFENLSGDKEQDYFADGITDDLTTDLSHLPNSFVISRGTAFSYKGKPVDAKQIGKDLGVRYLLEGSVRRVGETITVNAKLISTETGAHVWADRFDGERSKLGALQVEAVSRLANSLGVELVRAEALRAAHERPNNPDAVDLAMRGLAAYSQSWGPASVNEALGYFERALQLDPGHTGAKIGLAQALIDRFMWLGGGDEAVDIPRAEALIASALSAEPNNASAHYTKANLFTAKKQFSDQFAEVDAAIENDRNFAEAYALRGVILTWAGRAAETIAEQETALRLSPRDPGRGFWEYNICHAYAHLAQWEKAIEWCQKSIATSAENWLPYVDLAAASAWLGHDAEAKTAIVGLVKVYPGFTVQSFADVAARITYNPTFAEQIQRILEGLRKAGLPEGRKTTN